MVSRFGILLPVFIAACMSVFCFTPWSGGPNAQQESLTPLSKPPVAVKAGAIGDLLRKWYSSGTAAGNTGDYYDNRDGGHSLLDLAAYPQLQKIEYTEQEKKTRRHWGFQQTILPHVVFGNSSTSAPPGRGGSNVRNYYVSPRGVAFLFNQYVRNNIYIYPEHGDHDPGHNGIGGYGDLFPTNTPYLITSQGSSGSDQPFMRAIPYVLAAFQPDVKKVLVQSGLLMPTIQMILRITGRNLTNSREYLTGKAHPTVFNGINVDALAMVEMAHRISVSNVPPIAVIRIVKEGYTPLNGIDYFEPEYTETLADTPAVIARVFRGSKYLRKIVVSAESSRDINNKPLKYYWAVLRGDAEKTRIEYLNPSHSVAEITIPYQPRKPIYEESSLESNRTDIGVFVHNGVYYSPPAFITSFTLDNEARSYRSDGQPLEIGYGSGTSTISISDWSAFFDALELQPESWQSQLLRQQFSAVETAALNETGVEFRKIHAGLLKAQDILNKRGKDSTDTAAYRAAVREARKAEKRLLDNKTERLKSSAARLVQKAINSLLQDPNLWNANANRLETLYQSAGRDTREIFNQIREKLISLGVAENTSASSFRLTPVKNGETPVADRLTPFEKGMIERLNSVLLSGLLFPGIVESQWRENYVDPRISSLKEWRDVYQYASDGTPFGWRRYQSGGTVDFNAEGLMVLQRDARGRCLRARVVRYELEPQAADSIPRRVKLVPTETVRGYEYDGPNDWKGRVKP